jgi:dolichol-phosphate mannosyltransferase
VRAVPSVEESSRDAGNLPLRELLKHPGQILTKAVTSRELRRFIQFSLVGLSGVGVNLGTFWLLWEVIGIDDRVALASGYAAATLSNFILNDLWTFRDRRLPGLVPFFGRAPKFALVSAVAIGIYFAIYMPLTRYLGVYELLADAAAIAVGLVWNFTANVLWTWKKRSPTGSIQ